MTDFSLYDEIIGWNHTTDSEPAQPLPPVPRAANPSGPPLPWEDEIFMWRESAHAPESNSFIKTIETKAIQKEIFGTDLDSLPMPPAPVLSLTQRLAQSVSKAVDVLLPKVTHIHANAPARSARITEILDEAKQKLITKGYDGAASWDGWPKLHQSCESAIVATLMAVES